MHFDEKLPFQGLRMLVIRPGDGGDALAKALEEDGAKVLHVPTIAFEKPRDETPLKSMLSQLNAHDALIFVSAHAVSSCFEYLKLMGLSCNFTKPKLFAMGPSTLRALNVEGLDAFLPSESHSEGMLSHPLLQEVQGQSIAIVRGEFGRLLLEPELGARGARVTSVVTYRRILPTTISTETLKEQLRSSRIHVILGSSFDTVKHLWQLLPSSLHELLSEVPLLVMSERVRELASDLGCKTVWVLNTSDYTILRAFLINKRNERWQTLPKTH